MIEEWESASMKDINGNGILITVGIIDETPSILIDFGEDNEYYRILDEDQSLFLALALVRGISIMRGRKK